MSQRLYWTGCACVGCPQTTKTSNPNPPTKWKCDDCSNGIHRDHASR